MCLLPSYIPSLPKFLIEYWVRGPGEPYQELSYPSVWAESFPSAAATPGEEQMRASSGAGLTPEKVPEAEAPWTQVKATHTSGAVSRDRGRRSSVLLYTAVSWTALCNREICLMAALLSHECAGVKWACWRESLTVRAAVSSWRTSNSCCAKCLREPSRLCLVLCSRRGPLRDNLLFFKQLHWEIIHTRYNLPIKVYNSLCNKHISVYFQVCDPTISLRTCLSARLHVFLIYWQARSVSPQSSAQPSPREPLTGSEPLQPCQFRPFHRHGVRGQVPFAMGGISTWLSIYPRVSQWIFGLSHFFPIRNNPAMKTHSPVWRCFFHFSWVSNWEWNCYVTL